MDKDELMRALQEATGWRVERNVSGCRVWLPFEDNYHNVFFQPEVCDGSLDMKDTVATLLHDQWEWLRPELQMSGCTAFRSRKA